MTDDKHRIPEYLVAATRLGAAHELGQSMVVSVFGGQRHLYLAEQRGRVRYDRPVWVDPPDAFEHASRMILPALAGKLNRAAVTAQHAEDLVRVRAPVQVRVRDRWVVIEYLGHEVEAVRSVALASAASLGVPILTWPGERLPYVVEWPGRPLDCGGRPETDDEAQADAQLDLALRG